MLGVLSTRPKPWILTHFHSCSTATSLYNHRLLNPSSDHLFPSHHRNNITNHRTSSGCRKFFEFTANGSAATSIWHVIQPSSRFKKKRRKANTNDDVRRILLAVEPRGEGSWNVAWDARPARWLHRSDSAWLLFGVSECLGLDVNSEVNGNKNIVNSNNNNDETSNICDGTLVSYDSVKSTIDDDCSNDYKVTGVLADGRCLFRAIAHGKCLRSGEEAPDENRQRELADELRAQVVDELLKRRKETEWFIEGDFDAYVKRLQQPFVWGGEPEILMASHVLKTMISVFMIERTSGNLVNIANYGEEYKNVEVNPINVLFHGYGHYDLLESIGQSYQKVTV